MGLIYEPNSLTERQMEYERQRRVGRREDARERESLRMLRGDSCTYEESEA